MTLTKDSSAPVRRAADGADRHLASPAATTTSRPRRSSPGGADERRRERRQLAHARAQRAHPDRGAAPAPVSSDAYRAELASIKSTPRANLTDAQREAIHYWSGGGVLRWNQILRELVARYNLPPRPAGRRLLLCARRGEPVRRPAVPLLQPAVCRAGLQLRGGGAVRGAEVRLVLQVPVQPARALPGRQRRAGPAARRAAFPPIPPRTRCCPGSRPTCCKLLFPAAVEEITLKAAEQRNAALWSGKAAASDIAAGLALGKAVAAAFVARAATDGMRNAVGTRAQWEAFADRTAAGGEIPWTSLETPARPPCCPSSARSGPGP